MPPLPRLQLPPSHVVLGLIVLAFVAPGLVGHDPWRAFDAIAIEVAHQMHLTGDWIVPHLGREPWLEDPPLYHWLALAFGKALGGLLGFHNAARLASGVSMLAALWFVYLAARHWTPVDAPRTERRAYGACATLLLAGSLGLMVHAHEAVPDLATLAAFCAALWFLVNAARTPVKAGAGFGVALGVAFLSTGPLVPAVLGSVTLLAHVVCDDWRTRRALPFLGTALAAFVLLALSWPLALAWRSPELARTWWQMSIQPHDTFGANLYYYLVTASWFAWPAWPLALWSAWTLRRDWRKPRVFIPAATALVGLAGIAWLGPQQDINVILLLAPLALLGAGGVVRLRRGAANALDWFGVMNFTFFAGLVWLGYVAMLTGVPAKLAHNFLKTAPGYLPQFELVPFLAAAALALAWLYLAFFTAPAPSRGVTRWAAGIALLWGSFATLWMPWADHIKSYRNVALQLKSVLPPAAGCVAQRDVGAPQRAAFSYHAGLDLAPGAGEKCSLLLVQGHPKSEVAPGQGWRKLADVGRPADRGERYRLYRLQGK
jgi:4-amino-4-deoxy-L-arabinose transferase-like glycosyltransferase